MDLRQFSSIITLILCLSACLPAQKSRVTGLVGKQDNRWSSKILTVCYEQAGFDLDRQTIEGPLMREYAQAGFTFVGWDLCRDDVPADLRIRFDEDAPFSQTSGFGTDLKDQYGNVLLGLRHPCKVPYRGSACQVNVALHEFGHALGLHHEMNRRDNVECELQQFPDAGESSTNQIGDYDAASIMSYCRLYGGNDRGEYLGLSAGDIATLKAFYDAPIAYLTEPPYFDSYDSSPFDGRVSGHDIQTFIYQLGLRGNVDCQKLEAYSSPVAVAAGIDPAAVDALPRNRNLRLCLLGISADGRQQELSRYSSVDFVRANFDSFPVTQIEDMQIDSVTNPRFTQLTVRLDRPATGIESGYAQLAYRDDPNVSITSHSFTVHAADGSLTLLFPNHQLRKNGEIFLKDLILNMPRNPIHLQADAASLQMSGTLLPVPRTTLKGRFDPLTTRPDLDRVEILGDSSSMRFRILTRSPLGAAFIQVKFIQKGTGAVWEPEQFEDLTQISPTEFTVPMSAGLAGSNGVYTLDQLVIFDVFGQRWEYSLLAEVSGSPTFRENRLPVWTGLDLPSVIHLDQGTTLPLGSARVETEVGLYQLTLHFHLQGAPPWEADFEYAVMKSQGLAGVFELVPSKTLNQLKPGLYELTSYTLSPFYTTFLKPEDTVIPRTSIPVPRIQVLPGS